MKLFLINFIVDKTMYSLFSFFKPKNYIVADINKMTAEQELRQCFYYYAEDTGEPLLSRRTISEICARIKLNLSAKDLVEGVKKILDDRNIVLKKPSLFENFILGCKLLYSVRKRAVVSITHESLNQLNKNIRIDIVNFSNMLLKECEIESDLTFTKIEKVHVRDEPVVLQKLKISDTLSYDVERLLDGYGLTKCTLGSEVAIKEFLKMNGELEKYLVRVRLEENGDHVYNILASEIFYDADGNLGFTDGLVVDVWARVVYPVELTTKFARAWKWNYVEVLNSTEKITPEMVPTEIKTWADEVAIVTQDQIDDYRKKALDSFMLLYNVANIIYDRMEQYSKPINSSKDISAFLKTKMQDLHDFMWDLHFASQNITAEYENITMIDRLNDQIENLYTTLFCKILTTPTLKEEEIRLPIKGKFDREKLKVTLEQWHEEKAYLKECVRFAEFYILNSNSSENDNLIESDNASDLESQKEYEVEIVTHSPT